MMFDDCFMIFNQEQGFTGKTIGLHFGTLSLSSKSKCQIKLDKKMQLIRKIAIAKASQSLNSDERRRITLHIDRSQIWSQSVQQLFAKLTPEELAFSNIYVKFMNEIGQDEGGLRNEWVCRMVDQVMSVDYGLFSESANQRAIQPNSLAFLVPNYLIHFRYIGRLIGKAIIENWKLQVSFTRSFLKHILGRNLIIEDLDDISDDLGKQYLQTLEMKNIETLQFSFIFQRDTIKIFDQVYDIPIENEGEHKFVTDENKKEYIKSIAKLRMSENIREQIVAFKKGLFDMIPPQTLTNLTENELGLYLNGMPHLNIEEFQSNTSLEDGFTWENLTVQHFFQVLKEWSDEERAEFLFFLTGSHKVPIEGFKERQRFRLGKMGNSNERLPVSHTCFNKLDLPDYQDKEILKQKLQFAIRNTGGFGIS